MLLYQYVQWKYFSYYLFNRHCYLCNCGINLIGETEIIYFVGSSTLQSQNLKQIENFSKIVLHCRLLKWRNFQLTSDWLKNWFNEDFYIFLLINLILHGPEIKSEPILMFYVYYCNLQSKMEFSGVRSCTHRTVRP